jgi:polysaccharide pyruvyl transferase WcaK-like protein
VCPATPDEYFQLLDNARALISGRLHTAVVALSRGLPFLMVDLDKRTQGFIETYELQHATLSPSRISDDIISSIDPVLNGSDSHAWMNSISVRDQLANKALERLQYELAKAAI